MRDPEALARLARDLAGVSELALDTEGDSLHHYPERLALIQMALPGGSVWLVDPLAVPDAAPLGPVFADPRTVVVLHAGDNDLIQLKRRYGFVFAAIFDTAIAARFLGASALGLEALLQTWLGVTLPPSRQKDDWSARPLNEAQVVYAAADVRHLLALKRRLVEELAGAGRLPWVLEECAALAAQPAPEPGPDPDAYLGVKGARLLPARGRAVLRALWDLRERLALAADRPPFKVLSESTLLAIAEAAPRDAEALGKLPGVTPRVIAKWGVGLLAAVAGALELAEAELPELPRPRPRPRLSAPANRRIDALRGWRSEAASRAGLDPGVLLPNRLITAIAVAAPSSLAALAAVDGVRRWRAETFGPEILAALAGA